MKTTFLLFALICFMKIQAQDCGHFTHEGMKIGKTPTLSYWNIVRDPTGNGLFFYNQFGGAANGESVRLILTEEGILNAKASLRIGGKDNHFWDFKRLKHGLGNGDLILSAKNDGNNRTNLFRFDSEGVFNTTIGVRIGNYENNFWNINRLSSGEKEGDLVFVKGGIDNDSRTVVMRLSNNITLNSSSVNKYRLYVKDGIETDKLHITEVVGADYVFEEDYKLRSYAELRSFVQKNKHLPEVPPAAEMEEKGYDVAKMNETLLRKIEELTLYILDLENRLKDVENNQK